MLKDLWLVLRGDLSEAKFDLMEAERDALKALNRSALEIMEIYGRQRDDLTTTLLAIDEELSRIQQCSSWSMMQPIWARLWAGAEARRAHVSKRIGEQEAARIVSTFKPKDYEIVKEETDQMIRAAELDMWDENTIVEREAAPTLATLANMEKLLK